MTLELLLRATREGFVGRKCHWGKEGDGGEAVCRDIVDQGTKTGRGFVVRPLRKGKEGM